MRARCASSGPDPHGGEPWSRRAPIPTIKLVQIRLQRALKCEAEPAYETFVDVAALPRWVPAVTAASTKRHHPDGSAACVEFHGIDDEGVARCYRLNYAYDRKNLRVAWRAEDDAADGLHGFATFEKLPRGCRMTYTIDYGPRWAGDRQQAQRRADATMASFLRHLGEVAAPA